LRHVRYDPDIRTADGHNDLESVHHIATVFMVGFAPIDVSAVLAF
jgi:hypothetical protein